MSSVINNRVVRYLLANNASVAANGSLSGEANIALAPVQLSIFYYASTTATSPSGTLNIYYSDLGIVDQTLSVPAGTGQIQIASVSITSATAQGRYDVQLPMPAQLSFTFSTASGFNITIVAYAYILPSVELV